MKAKMDLRVFEFPIQKIQRSLLVQSYRILDVCRKERGKESVVHCVAGSERPCPALNGRLSRKNLEGNQALASSTDSC